MPNFTDQYRSLFERLGYPLKKSHAIDSELLVRTAQRLSVNPPDSLLDYYCVAGNEKRFNGSMHRFLHPSKWFVDRKHIVFVEENQNVCWWGVSTRSRNARDPMISQGIRQDDSIEWNKVHSKCSTFISVMLHYQAVSGGYPFSGTCEAPDNLHERLKGEWRYVGEVNQLWAFSRPSQVVCVTAGGGAPFMPAMMLTAGGKSRKDLEAIEKSLVVQLS